MLRIIIKTDNCGMACNVGGSVFTRYHTVDVNLPQIEELLLQGGSNPNAYKHTQVVGVEVLPVSNEAAKAVAAAQRIAELDRVLNSEDSAPVRITTDGKVVPL